jgi:hypothetical protein
VRRSAGEGIEAETKQRVIAVLVKSEIEPVRQSGERRIDQSRAWFLLFERAGVAGDKPITPREEHTMERRRSRIAKLVRTVKTFLFIVVAVAPAAAAEKLTAADRAAIVENLATAVEEGYVSPAKGRELATRLRRMGDDARFTEDDPEEFADVLQSTLREISGDLHFRVGVGSMADSIGGPQRRIVQAPDEEPKTPAGGGRRMVRGPSGVPETPADGSMSTGRAAESHEMSEELSGLFRHMSARYPDNYRAKILAGNVGLLEIDILFPPHDRLDAAMKALADTDALILDIRSCPGGTGLTTRPLESVFFAERTEMVTIALRGQEPEPIMSLEDTPGGVKYLGKPVYILTSRVTGSGCEELAWCLKYHDKAILIGETTAGAGHGINGSVDLGHNLSATIPSMRPIHPRFQGGWEVIGVPPDVTIGSRSAADEAHLMALSAIMENAEESKLRQLESVYAATAMEISRRQREYVDQGRSLRSYSASFEDGRRLHIKDGELYYTGDDGRTRGPLVPMDERDHFELARGIQRSILKVERGDDGEIQGISISPVGSEQWRRFKRVLPL